MTEPQPSTESILEAVKALGKKVTPLTPTSWAAQCPAHEDRKPSLTITDGGDKCLMHCHAGCSNNDILGVLALQPRDMFNKDTAADDLSWIVPQPRPLPTTETHDEDAYVYQDAKGAIVGRVLRKPGKKFTQQAFNDGQWLPSLNGVKLPLYNLVALLARKDETVYLVEGEKDANTLMVLGHLAITNAGGVNGWRPDMTDHLTGRTVVIIADNDKPGLERAQRLLDDIATVAASVTAYKSDLGKDITDHIHAGGTLDTLIRIDGDEVERTSWWPIDIGAIIRGEAPAEPPPVFTIDDSNAPALFYAGKVNGLIGESESGKTWVALGVVMRALRQQQTVAYFDFEDTASGIVSRLRLLGATDDNLQLLHYINPDQGLDKIAIGDLRDFLGDTQPAVAIVDGFNAAMTLLGLDLMSNTDATKFSQMLLKPLTKTGASVIYVDHVPKSVENRGKGGIGAQAKRAMTTGCAILVESVEPFGRGQDGRIRLSVDKDRPGYVRGIATFGKEIGSVELGSDADTGKVTITWSLLTEIERKTETNNIKFQRYDDTVLQVIAKLSPTVVSENALWLQHFNGTDIISNAELKKTLKRLTDQGVIVRKGKGSKTGFILTTDDMQEAIG